jgi:hypothetical protein
MTNKGIVFKLAAVTLSMGLTFTACKKKEEDKPEETTTATSPSAEETAQSGSDNRDALSENDAAVSEANEAMSGNGRVSGTSAPGGNSQVGAKGTLCGLTVDSAFSNTGVLKLNYNGTTCNNRTRTGSIRLTLQSYTAGVRWKDPGAVIKIEYLNYKITRASDQKSMLINGTQFLTNVSGGNWVTLALGQPSLVSTITGTNLNVTFQDNKTAVYNINRKLTYTFANPVLTARAEGIGTSGNMNALENFGTTRDGDSFTSQVITPVVWNSTCGGGAPMQGVLKIVVPAKSFDLTFTYGVDASGNPVVVGPNQCPFGWKLQWTANSQSNSKTFGYF